jgi:gliding motility-associated-like protein
MTRKFQVIGSGHRNGDNDDGTNRGAAGQMKVNDNGTRLALAVEGGKFFELFQFNPATGVISNPLQIPAGDQANKFEFKYGAYGVEFSPTGRYGFEATSGNYLYGTSRDGGQIYQWDLSLYNGRDSVQFIKTGQIKPSIGIEYGALQRAPNGKIYVAIRDQDFLGVINSPMRPNFKFEKNGVRLISNDTGLGGVSLLGLPAPVPLLINPEPFYFENLCLGDTTLFYITNQSSITLSTPKAWRFTNLDIGGPIVTKSSVFNELEYEFPRAGRYKVQLTVIIDRVPVTYTRELTINPLPSVRLIENNVRDTVPLCVGSSVKLNAGSGAFYVWEDETLKDRERTVTTNENFYNLYRVKVTDYHGCVGWDTIITRREYPPTSRDSSVAAFCEQNDGKAIVIPNGKIENYNYAWENYPDSTGNTLSGIPGGDYAVKVTRKSTGCEVMDTIRVEAVGRSDVKLVKSIETGCPGETVNISVQGADEVEWISHPELKGSQVSLAPDTTTVVRIRSTNYRDGRTCRQELTDTIHVFPKNKPELGENRTPCGGNPIFIDGGDDYVKWLWSDGQTGQFARIGSDADNLVLWATDHNGCVFSDTVSVKFLPGPVLFIPKDTAFCTKDPITLIGGEGESYQWSSWDSTQTIPLSGTADLSITKSGYYIFDVTRSGCTLSDTVYVHLNDPGKFRIDSVRYQDISCFGAADGEIRVFATGTARNYYYSIDGGETYFDNDGLFTNLPPGNPYRVVVNEDSTSCRAEAEPFNLPEPDTLKAKFCTLPASCAGCSDGAISLGMITGGTEPYSVYLEGEKQDSVIYNLEAGNYLLTVVDSHGCTIEKAVRVAEGSRPEILSDAVQPVCPGQPVTLRIINASRVEWITPADGTGMEVTVMPWGNTVYRAKSIETDEEGFSCEIILEYPVEVYAHILPELGDTIHSCEGEIIGLDGGEYLSWEWSNGQRTREITIDETTDELWIAVQDANGCVLGDTVSVQFHPYPEIELGDDREVCSSEPIVLRGGTAQEYRWSNDAVTPEILVTESGNYALILVSYGCVSMDSVRIQILDPGSFSIRDVKVVDNNCFGAENGSLEIVADGSGQSFKYSIDGGVSYQAGNHFDFLPSGEYDGIRVMADSLCFKDYPDAVTIGQPDSIGISFRLKSPTCETCGDGQLHLTITGGRPPYAITLNGSAAEAVSRDLAVGSYLISVTDAAQCTKTAEFTLEMLNLVPNVITANGDGINDHWKIPLLKYYPDAVVKVFTAAGRLVFQSPRGYPVPWNGKDGANPLPMGTYYYVINLGPGEETVTGYLTILR